MKKMLKVFLMLPIIGLSGCWSSIELNELAIVTAMGIDKKEDGYLVTVQVLNSSELAGDARSGRTEVVTFRKSGATIAEAIRSLSTDVPRRLYVAHLREVVFGEEMARAGIAKPLDVLSRQKELRSDFYMTVAKGSTAYDTLNVQTALEKIPANKVFDALENSETRWAPTRTVTLDELVSSIVSKGRQAMLTGILVYGDPEAGSNVTNAQDISPKSGLRLDYLGVFKKDKLVGWLNRNDSKGVSYITDHVKSTAVNIPCEGDQITVNTTSTKTKIKGKMEKGNPKIDINVTSEGSIGEVECTIDLTKPEKIEELNKRYAKDIKDKIEGSIKTLQEKYQSDIFGFGDEIHRTDPKAWKRLEGNWDQEFAKLDVNVTVKAKIRNLGTISESFQKEIEE
ncbi:Ger(x)C family spore germination protein [Peribacillus frigoritolerans]|uniref:Ger(x)C family spore germination protein n=2 Tax=Bacillaceae TaxID=186817 RepID=UPI0021AA172B|nr:Ger(x)C family spore germination protein [Peribacillus frigoritolerans]MCT4479922.1 Ger(x)C family spore germination protein [Peribacillus frigoritolerans]